VKTCIASSFLILPFLPLITHYNENDRSDYFYASDLGKNILRSLSQNAIIVPTSDHATFPLIYFQAVEGMRPDIDIADKYGYIEDEYLEKLFRTNKQISSFPPKNAERREKLRYLIEHTNRPVFLTMKEAVDSQRYEVVTHGLLFTAKPIVKEQNKVELEELWKSYSWHPNTFEGEYRDYSADMILADFYFARARHKVLLDKKGEAKGDLELAARHAWGVKEVLNNIGSFLAESDMPADAVPFLLDAWRVDNGYVTAQRNIAIAYERSKNYVEGLWFFLKELERNPNDPVFVLAAARAYRAKGDHGNAVKYYFRLEGLGLPSPEVYDEIKATLEGMSWPKDLLETYDKKKLAMIEDARARQEKMMKEIESQNPNELLDGSSGEKPRDSASELGVPDLLGDPAGLDSDAIAR